MLKMLALLALLATATGASASEWFYEDRGMPIAYADTGTAQFHFACRDGELAMGFGVVGPDPQVAQATAMSLALTPDAAPGGGQSYYAEDLPLLHGDSTWMVVRGPVARQWAKIAQRARTSLGLAFMRSDARGGMALFDPTAFGAAGSSAAIGRVLERCG